MKISSYFKNFSILALILVIVAGCGSNNNQDENSNSDTLNMESKTKDLNTFISNTLFDSIPVEEIPYVDSISLGQFKPLRRIPLSSEQLEFLQLKELRVFRQYDRSMDDSLFSVVCRLKLSSDFYSIIVNYNGRNETMNYLVHYDGQFRLIDYLETCFDEMAESALRLSARIDSSSVQVSYADILHGPELQNRFTYRISPDGFFREEIAKK